jgi:hypothetical protein
LDRRWWFTWRYNLRHKKIIFLLFYPVIYKRIN